MKKYEGINYGFRPDSYWVDKTIRQSILRDIKGTERRKLIDDALKNGRFDKVEDALVGAELKSGLRIGWEQYIRILWVANTFQDTRMEKLK